MTKKMKNSFLLLLSITLTACGLAEPSAPYETDPDETAPHVIGSTPINKGVLDFNDNTITLKLDEAIDSASLITLNALPIKSTIGIQLAGSWSFNETNNELVFTLDNRNNVPANQRFIIDMKREITDKAGNFLETKREFSTPSLFEIQIASITGLASDDTLEITQTLSGSTEVNVINLNGDSENVIVDIGLKDGDIYSLSITQAAQNSFCTLSSIGGTILSNDIDIDVKCHGVMPAYPNASKWNRYFSSLPDPNAHGGELKKVTFQTSDSCDDLNAEDTLGAFDWECSKEEATNNVTFSSTGLKTDKGLTDLVKFEAPSAWLGNRLIVKKGDAEVHRTAEGIWWTNPVIAISNESTLTSEGTIFLIQEGSDLTKRIHISGSGIALLIDSNVDFSPVSNAAGILISKDITATWVEGKINAKFSTIGIQAKETTLAVLHNVTVENARTTGIDTQDTYMTQIRNSLSTSNSGYGISINSTSRLAQIRNTTSSNNALSGITIAASQTTVAEFSSLNNEEDGIVVTGNNNRLIDIFVSNNQKNGLVILGADNNIINTATITSNGINGLQLEQSAGGVISSRNNLFSNITLANNTGMGIMFDTLEADAHSDNQLINILDAYNLELECPGTDCNSVTTVSTDDIALSDLFDTEDSLWYLNASNNIYALEQLSSTELEPANTHQFLYSSELSFLNNAVEIYGDNVGNDNSLCETNERCIFTPNIGSYQGHGDLVPLESNNSLNATIFTFSENGR